MESSENGVMAENIWSVDKDDKYGYKSLMVHLCSPDRFLEPDKVEIAHELQGYLNKTEWNDIYDLSKIRKRAKTALGVIVDVAELYSHLMEVFSPEKYRKMGYGVEQVEQYNEICKTLTDAKDDINQLESELYDIAKLDVDLRVEPEVVQTEPQEKVGAEKLADDDVLIGEVYNAEDDIEDAKDESCPVEPKTETKPKTEIVAEVKVESKPKTDVIPESKPKPEPKPELKPKTESKPKPKPVKPPVPANPAPKEQGMFSHPFSFNGRIRRTEYWFSLIFAAILIFIFSLIYDSPFRFLCYIVYAVILWFLLAQRAKRCHDIGNSGWWQLYFFADLWLLFENSEYGENEYGDCPK